MSCTCFIIPPDVLKKLGADKKLSARVRDAAENTAKVSAEVRRLRTQAVALTSVSAFAAVSGALAKAPAEA